MARLSVERVGLFLFFVLRHFTSCVPSSLSRRKSTGRDCRMCSATLDRCKRDCSRNTKTNAPISSTSDPNSFLYPFSMSHFHSVWSSGIELLASLSQQHWDRVVNQSPLCLRRVEGVSHASRNSHGRGMPVSMRASTSRLRHTWNWAV